MFIFTLWDIILIDFINALYTALPTIAMIVAIIILGGGFLIILGFGLQALDDKYLHSKTWPWYKQLLVSFLFIIILAIIIFIVLLIVCNI